MNERRIPLTQEKPKHKKKSQGNGLSRSKHKHEYIPVLLHRPWHNRYKDETINFQTITNVCKICGRIDYDIDHEKYYDTEYIQDLPYKIGRRVLNKKALSLPKYYVHDSFDKFAYEGEINENKLKKKEREGK